MMNNALVKQRESIRHVDIILQGIHEIDEAKVMAGLQGLRHIDFNNLPTPLSPSFDLVTGISPGREDFLTLERMHLLALVIRHMAQGVYQWTQKNNRGVASVTQEALTTSLEKLIKLLEPTKEPCIASITHLHCAKAMASCLARPASSTVDEWWDRLIFVGELIGDSLQLTAGITTGRADTGFKAALSILQRLYKLGAPMHKMLQEANAQTLVMQIAAVDAWQGIVMLQAGSNVAALEKEPIKKTLEALKQYFEEGVLGQENKRQKATRLFKKAKGAMAHLVQAAPRYRQCLIEVLYTEIGALEENLANPAAGQDHHLVDTLRKIAFHALVDLYVETADESVRCEILKVFGTLASGLCTQASWSADQLNSLLEKSAPIQASDPNAIEQAAFRILVEAIWPTVLKQQNDPVVLSLTSGKAVELSKKWPIQCTAIEALLRCNNQYKRAKKSEDKTPIRSFLDEMGREYHVTALLLNKFGLSKNKITALRDFLHHAKRLHQVKAWLRKTASLQEAGIEKLLMEAKSEAKAHEMQKALKLEEKEIEALLKGDGATMLASRGSLAKKLKLAPSAIDLISDFLREKISQKQLTTQAQNIKQWLGETLKLQDSACDTLLQFLQQDKAQPAAQPQQEKYSQEPVRPVLDKLIDQFNLTKAEREVIDETIFKGQRAHTAQESMIEKVGEALKSFFGQDNYPKIACAFNNLASIEAMIDAENRLWVKEPTIGS